MGRRSQGRGEKSTTQNKISVAPARVPPNTAPYPARASQTSVASLLASAPPPAAEEMTAGVAEVHRRLGRRMAPGGAGPWKKGSGEDRPGNASHAAAGSGWERDAGEGWRGESATARPRQVPFRANRKSPFVPSGDVSSMTWKDKYRRCRGLQSRHARASD